MATPAPASRKRSAGSRRRRKERPSASRPTFDLDGGLPPSVRALFEGPLREALRGRSRVCAVKLERGRRDDEVVARITSEGRPGDLPLYFPDTPAMRPEDVLRIVRSVLEGMGPAAP